MVQKRSSSGRPSRLYLFHQHMSFLNKVIDTSIPQENSDNNEKEERITGNINDEASVEECRTPQFECITKFEAKSSISDSQRKISNALVEGFSKSETTTIISDTERKRKSDLKNELAVKMMKYLDHEITTSKNVQLENRHMSFFKGLVPSLCSLSDDETLEFQSGVISVLQNIKSKKQMLVNDLTQNSVQQSNYEWQSPSSVSQFRYE
ncbi:hypothetical protein C0J52_25710 [Blattella germanica]|nr:hypothetical protein C0J52_25710 [Blattella germanica]